MSAPWHDKAAGKKSISMLSGQWLCILACESSSHAAVVCSMRMLLLACN
jgi:hypothetical protein